MTTEKSNYYKAIKTCNECMLNIFRELCDMDIAINKMPHTDVAEEYDDIHYKLLSDYLRAFVAFGDVTKIFDQCKHY